VAEKRKSDSLSKEERQAVKDRAKELKQQKTAADGEKAVKEAIAKLSGADQAIARKLQAIVTEVAPDLAPKTYYGMPGWARDGKILCFFQPASKFGTRYGTFGFEQPADLDDGDLWPTAFAILKIGSAEEKKIRALVKKAAG
jgi:uncharacterized protein YdhG (YjbR/CyaY superfamily)